MKPSEKICQKCPNSYYHTNFFYNKITEIPFSLTLYHYYNTVQLNNVTLKENIDYSIKNGKLTLNVPYKIGDSIIAYHKNPNDFSCTLINEPINKMTFIPNNCPYHK